MAKKNSVRTSASVASKASKIMTSGNYSKASKTVAASALANRKAKSK